MTFLLALTSHLAPHDPRTEGSMPGPIENLQNVLQLWAGMCSDWLLPRLYGGEIFQTILERMDAM